MGKDNKYLAHWATRHWWEILFASHPACFSAERRRIRDTRIHSEQHWCLIFRMIAHFKQAIKLQFSVSKVLHINKWLIIDNRHLYSKNVIDYFLNMFYLGWWMCDEYGRCLVLILWDVLLLQSCRLYWAWEDPLTVCMFSLQRDCKAGPVACG